MHTRELDSTHALSEAAPADAPLCEHCGAKHSETTRFCPETGALIAARLLPAGSVLEGKYQIGRVLGVGGMGAVFAATHTLLGHSVAIKVMLPEFSRDEQMSARLIREGRAASATGHPNIALVTDMGRTQDDALFVVMEYIAGQTLTDLIAREGPLKVPRASSLMTQVLSGLEAVHRCSIIHRDLKPDNVMVVPRADEEMVKILDFGISKMADEELKQGLTATGLVMGTPHYMAPEQSRGAADIDHRADLYAAAAIFYTLLTGEPPLSANTLAELLYKLTRGEIDPPSRKNHDLSPGVDRVVMRGLALEPAYRYADARSFRAALKPLLGGRAPDGVSSDLAEPGPVAPPPIDIDINVNALVGLDEITPVPQAVTDHLLTPAPLVSGADSPAAGGATAPDRFRPPAAAGSSFMPQDDERPLELDESSWHERTGEVSGAGVAETPAPAAKFSQRTVSQGVRGTRLQWVVVAGLVACGGLVYYVAGGEEPPPARRVPQIVRVNLALDPPHAAVAVDGVRQVGNVVRLPRSERPFSVSVSARGYAERSLQVVPNADKTLEVHLTKLESRSKPIEPSPRPRSRSRKRPPRRRSR